MNKNNLFGAMILSCYLFTGMLSNSLNADEKIVNNCKLTDEWKNIDEPSRTLEDKLSYHEVKIEINKPVKEAYSIFLKVPLEDFIEGTEKLPGVKKTIPLNNLPYGEEDYLRLVCLKDGNVALEKLLKIIPNSYFPYLVYGYTSDEAKPILYGLGEFTFKENGNKTILVWRYSFKLKDNKFPGFLGGLGRWLFEFSFLESDYAEFMDKIIVKIKKEIENRTVK